MGSSRAAPGVSRLVGSTTLSRSDLIARAYPRIWLLSPTAYPKWTADARTRVAIASAPTRELKSHCFPPSAYPIFDRFIGRSFPRIRLTLGASSIVPYATGGSSYVATSLDASRLIFVRLS